MIKVCFVRGKFLNNFEGQNYLFNSPNKIQLTAVSSLFPIHRDFPFRVKKLISLADIPFMTKEIKYIGNRLIGDSQILFGLEDLTGKFEIYHTADPHYYYSYQLAKLREKNLIKKLIVTSWETIPFNNEAVERKRFIKYFTLKQADDYICYTQKAKKTLVLEGVNPIKISVVRLGVDLDRFTSEIDKNPRSRKFVKNRKITILFVGRLVEEKGILDLYEAFKNIKYQIAKISTKGRSPSRRKNTNQKSNIEKIQLKIIGDGVLKSDLINLIRQDGLTNDIHIEKKTYGEMPKVYREADIFVLLSKRTKTWEEQYGMVLVEAMASGLPIIAYDTGAISEIVGNVGILIKEGDKKKLTTSIKHLIEVDELRVKLGKMGRQRAEKEFDAKKTARKILKIYENIGNNFDEK